MGVTLRVAAALDLAFEFAEAAAELMVELLLLDELSGLTVECYSGASECLREPIDPSLLRKSLSVT